MNNNIYWREFDMSELIDDWYDYTNQKALRLPPVGSLVEYCDGSANVYIVGYSEDCQLVYQCEYNLLVTKDQEIFRPLDWDREVDLERNKFAATIAGRDFNGYVMTWDTAKALYDFGLCYKEDK
jgi:hypothetical protein